MNPYIEVRRLNYIIGGLEQALADRMKNKKEWNKLCNEITKRSHEFVSLIAQEPWVGSGRPKSKCVCGGGGFCEIHPLPTPNAPKPNPDDPGWGDEMGKCGGNHD